MWKWDHFWIGNHSLTLRRQVRGSSARSSEVHNWIVKERSLCMLKQQRPHCSGIVFIVRHNKDLHNHKIGEIRLCRCEQCWQSDKHVVMCQPTYYVYWSQEDATNSNLSSENAITTCFLAFLLSCFLLRQVLLDKKGINEQKHALASLKEQYWRSWHQGSRENLKSQARSLCLNALSMHGVALREPLACRTFFNSRWRHH